MHISKQQHSYVCVMDNNTVKIRYTARILCRRCIVRNFAHIVLHTQRDPALALISSNRSIHKHKSSQGTHVNTQNADAEQRINQREPHHHRPIYAHMLVYLLLQLYYTATDTQTQTYTHSIYSVLRSSQQPLVDDARCCVAGCGGLLVCCCDVPFFPY